MEDASETRTAAGAASWGEKKGMNGWEEGSRKVDTVVDQGKSQPQPQQLSGEQKCFRVACNTDSLCE